MLLVTLLASAAFCFGYVAQNVLAVYWTTSSLSPYGILLVNCLAFPILFGTGLLLTSLIYRDKRILLPADDIRQCNPFAWSSLHQTLVIIGFLNALNGLGIIYASPANHTPPIIQAILQNSGALFAVPFSKYILGDQRKYLSLLPMVAAVMVAASVVVSMLPTIINGQGNQDFNGGTTVGWVMVYLTGLIPGAGYNVCQQRYLILAGALHKGADLRKVVIATFRVLFYGCFWMLFFMGCFFWLDLTPWFGTSNSIESFSQITRFSLTCSFAGPNAVGDPAVNYPALQGAVCDPNTAGYAYGFVLAYTVAYLGGAVLNRESSTYTMLIFVLITVLTSVYWFIPGTPGDRPTVWAVVISLILSLGGMSLWKKWELQYTEPQFMLVADEDELLAHNNFGSNHNKAFEYSDRLLLEVADRKSGWASK